MSPYSPKSAPMKHELFAFETWTVPGIILYMKIFILHDRTPTILLNVSKSSDISYWPAQHRAVSLIPQVIEYAHVCTLSFNIRYF